MATALKLKNDIKKLKAAINSKATPKSFVPKLKAQLDKAENELESLKKGGRPRKTSTTKGTQSTLSALQKLIQKKKYSVYQGAGVDLKKDAGEGALATGRRVSKGLKSNQWGDASDNKGNVYYEYRANRLDVKQPKKAQKYPKLEKGGMMSHGGKIPNNYKGKNEREVWDSWNYDQKFHFLNDHKYDKSNPLGMSRFDLSDIADKSSYDELPKNIKLAISDHISEGQYAKGGYMAKGGQIAKFKIIPMKKIEIAGSPDLLEPYYSLAFTVEGTISEANEKAQQFVKNNDGIISATVTKIHPSGQPLKNKKVSYITKDEILKYEQGGEIAAKKRLEELRKELRAERISYEELAELESLAEYIDENDVELRQAAGIPEFDEDEYASGGILKGRNNDTGETFGVVIGSVKKADDELEGAIKMNVRSGYSSRISEVQLIFDKNGNLYSITDFGYGIDGKYPDTNGGSGRTYNADKKETLEVLSKKYNSAFAKKLIELAKGKVEYKGYMENGGELHRSKEKYAMGGALEHGLKVGDHIMVINENILGIKNEDSGEFATLDISTGERNNAPHLRESLGLMKYYSRNK